MGRHESRVDDYERSGRLLDDIEGAYATRTGDLVDGGPLTDFEETVTLAASPDPGSDYPPPGHGYPRRD
ncbi:hypothetical protein [Streptomyces sp. NPDC046925]|uniref:hypothetical protein n=1 Tax=Streptomyces sp. NPDC046925 TaxID=3155375 RepID=UPI0033F1F6AA